MEKKDEKNVLAEEIVNSLENVVKWWEEFGGHESSYGSKIAIEHVILITKNSRKMLNGGE